MIAAASVHPTTTARGALAGFLIFVGLFYSINYQYLVVYIPLAILVASTSYSRCERAITMCLVLFPAVWLWLYDTSFWFNYFQPTSPWVTPIMAGIGLANHAPDCIYVAFALILMFLALTHVALAFLRWHTAD